MGNGAATIDAEAAEGMGAGTPVGVDDGGTGLLADRGELGFGLAMGGRPVFPQSRSREIEERERE